MTFPDEEYELNIPLARIARAPEFEKRLADYISSFEKHRSTLHHLLTSYTAGVVQKTHAAVNRLEYQVENLISILHRLESSREKEAARFIDANGGIEKCIGDKKLLVDLMNRTGYSFVDFRSSAAYDEESRARMVELTMKQVQNELKEDFEDMLQKNLSNFEIMLQIQSKNLELVMHHVYNQTSLMMKISNEMATMFPGKRAYVLITDPVSINLVRESGAEALTIYFTIGPQECLGKNGSLKLWPRSAYPAEFNT